MSYKYVSKLYDYLIYKNGRGSCCGFSVPSWVLKYVNKYTLFNFLTNRGLVKTPTKFKRRLDILIAKINNVRKKLLVEGKRCGVSVGIIERFVRNTFYDAPSSISGIEVHIQNRIRQFERKYCIKKKKTTIRRNMPTITQRKMYVTETQSTIRKPASPVLNEEANMAYTTSIDFTTIMNRLQSGNNTHNTTHNSSNILDFLKNKNVLLMLGAGVVVLLLSKK